VPTVTLGAVLRRGLLAGLLAGAVAAVVALLVVEPTIRSAVAIEAARSAAEPADHTHGELVGRTTQVIGGLVAAIVVALCLALIFATLFARVRHRLPAATDLGRAALLAGSGFLAVALVPALKYPANPPGVGDPATVTTRTWQYVTLIAASIAVTTLAYVARTGLLKRGWQATHAVVGSTVITVLAYVVLLVVWPANPDPIPADVPAGLLWDFRLASLAELAAMWATLGLAFGLLLTPWRAPAPTTPDTASTTTSV
jgi:predicted cobalt transporter CbtA